MKKALFIALMLTRLALGEYVYLPSASEGVLTPYLSNYYIWGYAPTPVTSDVLLWYDMGLSDVSTNAVDSSGNNLFGKPTGATLIYATNGLKTVWNFDDSGQYILSPTNLPTVGTTLTEYMIEMWVKPVPNNYEDGFFAVTKFNKDHGAMYAYCSFATTLKLAMQTIFTTRSVNATLVADKWQHFIWWWKPSLDVADDGFRVYKDGVFVRKTGILTNDAIVVEALDKFVVGARYSSQTVGRYELNGQIARFKVHTNAPAGSLMAGIALATNKAQKVTLGIASDNYGFEDNEELDWTGASLANDGSKNNFTLTSASAPTMGGSANPNVGWGSFVSPNLITIINDNSVLTNGFTYAGWASCDEGGGEQGTILSSWGTLAPHNFGIFAFWDADAVGNGELVFRVQEADGNYPFVSATRASKGSSYCAVDRWNFYTAVADGTNLNIYINGLFETNAPYDGTIYNGTNDTYLGTLRDPMGTYWMPGKLSRCRIYDRPLIASEILNMHTNEMYNYGMWTNYTEIPHYDDLVYAYSFNLPESKNWANYGRTLESSVRAVILT